MSEERMLNVGKVVNTHGIRGELKVWPHTDFPSVRFKKGSRLLLRSPETGETIPVVVEGAREQKSLFLLKFKGYDDINQVEKYKGWELKVGAEERVPLEEGEYYVRDIVGCKRLVAPLFVGRDHTAYATPVRDHRIVDVARACQQLGHSVRAQKVYPAREPLLHLGLEGMIRGVTQVFVQAL
ncbi:MAG: ribosome maturation factor RimM [Bryobacteraceae bacterium]|nr:ribosome maturation factor RimM [Bryobacteraceae bacterium]